MVAVTTKGVNGRVWGGRVLMLERSDPELHCSQEFRHSLPVLSCRLVCCPPASTVMLIGA